MTGITIAPDGTKICRTDTFNAYIWDERAATWRELLTRMTLPSGDVPHPRYWGDQSGGGRSDGPGCWEATCAPSDTNRIYAVWNAYCYKSTDRGRSFTRTNLPRIFSRANDQNFAGGIERLMGPKMAVDPNNPDVVWLSGDQGDGLWYSIDGGASWAQQTQVPLPTDGTGSATGTGPYLIVFDPTSNVVNGRTQGLYVASYGRGLYRSTDGGHVVPAAPGRSHHLPPRLVRPKRAGLAVRRQCGPAAHLQVPEWRLDPARTEQCPGRRHRRQPRRRDAHHRHLQYIILRPVEGRWRDLGPLVWPYQSSLSAVQRCRDRHSLAAAGGESELGLECAAIAFERTTGRCYIATGVGMFYVDQFPIATSTSFEVKSQSFGIEQLCVRRIVAPPGGAPVTAQLDRSVMRIADPDVPPSSYGPSCRSRGRIRP